MAKVHAALECPQILHAGDDFLAGIAAFFETHAIDQLQVGHLRHERLAGDGEHRGQARKNFQQPPGGFTHRRPAYVQAFPALPCGLQGTGVHLETRLRAGDTQHCEIGMPGHLVHRVRAGPRGGQQLARCLRATDTDAQEVVGDVLQRDLRADHVHAQPLQYRFQGIRRQPQVVDVIAPEDPHQSQHTSLGGAVCAQLTAVPVVEQADIVAELGLQETARIRSVYRDHPLVFQVGEYQATQCRPAFALRVAEMRDPVMFEFCTGVHEERLPLRFHASSCGFIADSSASRHMLSAAGVLPWIVWFSHGGSGIKPGRRRS